MDSRSQSHEGRLAKKLERTLGQKISVTGTKSYDSDNRSHLYVELLALESAATDVAPPTLAFAGTAGAKSVGPVLLRPQRP
jgi:hypothetical protein